MLTNQIKKFDEEFFFYKLDNGLTVILNPIKDRNKIYATFTAKYGSFDNYINNNPLPNGIAHFLEHKLFETKNGDAFNDLSKLGVDANAFTTYDRTSYLFTATETESFYNALTILLDFVQELYISEESVNKEKGIIEQEINMYKDNTDFRIYTEALKAMYKDHPISIDVAGEVEDIMQINKESLTLCHAHFYNPANMILFINGPIDNDEVLDFVKKNQSTKQLNLENLPKPSYIKEPRQVNQKEINLTMDVSRPKALVGLKIDKYESGRELLKLDIGIEILFDILLGESTELRAKLRRDNIIDDSFDLETTVFESCVFAIFAGDVDDTSKFISSIKDILLDAKNLEITQEELERNKRVIVGQFIKSMNSQEYIGNQLVKYVVQDINFFDIIDIAQEITVDYINNLKDIFNEDAITNITITPKST